MKKTKIDKAAKILSSLIDNINSDEKVQSAITDEMKIPIPESYRLRLKIKDKIVL